MSVLEAPSRGGRQNRQNKIKKNLMFLGSPNVTSVMFLGSPTNVCGLCSSVMLLGSLMNVTSVTSVMLLSSPTNIRAYIPQCHVTDECNPLFVGPDGPMGLYSSDDVPRLCFSVPR
jgi:hypothetical protein